MSAAAVMTALQTILPAGTTVATTLVQKGLDAASAAFPVLIINCPRSRRLRRTMGRGTPKQWVYDVHVLYLDRWESSTRDLETIMADADSALDVMVANVDANPGLTVSGTDHAAEAGDSIEKHLDGPVHDEGLGFPLICGELIIAIKDFWTT